MTDFDPKEWADRFEPVGGVLSIAPDGCLWSGVVYDRPDRGRAGRALHKDLEAHPEWMGPLTEYIAGVTRRAS